MLRACTLDAGKANVVRWVWLELGHATLEIEDRCGC
jgi:hypothetical protein